MGQDPLRHVDPDPAERLLRSAAAAHLPARQRLFDMSGFPHRARVPARTPGTAAANPDPDRRIRTRRARPHGRDEPAGADQPEPDDQRGREDRDRGHGHHPCALTTPTTSSPPPAAEPPPHAAGPSPQSVGWTMQDNRFHSTRWRAKGRSPGPGSTTSPTCAPRSNDSAPGEIQGPPGTVFRTGNAHPTLPSGADSRLRPNETASWRPRTDTYARHLRSPSANCAQPPSSVSSATRRSRNLNRSSDPADACVDDTAEQRANWHALVAAVESTLRLRDHVAGTLPEMAEQLYRRSRGMIGSLSQLVRGAFFFDVEDATEKITAELLDL